jgi:Flp pilus assembly protein TadG
MTPHDAFATSRAFTASRAFTVFRGVTASRVFTAFRDSGPARGAGPGERGSMSVFTVIFSVMVFLLAGLLVDGGAAINARLRAADIAEQAGRAAADQIDVEHLRTTGQARLLEEGTVCAKAEEIVSAYAASDVRLGECTVGAGQAEVTVRVSVGWKAFFLAALGFPGSDTEAEATAGPDTGEDA